MNIEYISVNALIPYERNTKIHDDKQTGNIAESIRNYGFVQPLVIDKNNVVVIGHGRLLAAKKLKMKEVPCVLVDDLTEEQVKALRIVDNKTALDTGFDYDVLPDELADLDLSDFDFDFGIDTFEFESETEDTDEEEKVNERERTYKEYNLQYNDLERTAGKYQMPIIEPCYHIPKDLIGFNYALSSNKYDCGVHFFVDDYQMSRCWGDPEKYGEVLAAYDCAFTPDFSLYSDMPIALMIYNTYRSRLCGQIWQDMGLRVVPTVSWADKSSYDFCFDGLPENSTLAISTIGVKRDEEATTIWKNGVDELIKRKTPKTLLVYGGEVEYDYGRINVIYYQNVVTERMKEYGKQL